jgi:hypothetical protein
MLQILVVIETIHVGEGVAIVEDEVMAFLIETKAIIRNIILVMDKVKIVVMARKGIITNLYKETIFIHKKRPKWQGMMLDHHKNLMVHVIGVVAQAIAQGPVAHLHIIINFINSPLKEKKKKQTSLIMLNVLRKLLLIFAMS